MAKKNTVTFEVEGIGTFTTLVEKPARAMFLNRRSQMAELLGGSVELARREAMIRKYKSSEDPIELDIADTLAYEIVSAQWYLDLQDIIESSPQSFDLKKVTSQQLDAIRAAYEVAVGGKFPASTNTAAPQVADQTSQS